MGKVPGWLASGLGVYQDYQKYSGGDFVIAAGADIAGPTIVGAAGAAGGAKIGALYNPAFGVVGGIVGGVAGSVEGDKVAADIKDKYAVTDEEKHANKN